MWKESWSAPTYVDTSRSHKQVQRYDKWEDGIGSN